MNTNPALITNAEALGWNVAPREAISIADFAERYIVLPARFASAPGPVSLAQYPYVRPILDAVGTASVRRVTICSASQCAKTSMLEWVSAYYAIHVGGQQLWVFPTENISNRYVSARLRYLIEASPHWRSHLLEGGVSIALKGVKYRDGDLHLGIADSESDLSSTPARIAIADETGKWPESTTNEGSPLDQLQRRLRTFPDSKFLDASTPTNSRGAIWQAFLDGSQHEWFVPCLACGDAAPWDHNRIEWEERPRERSLARHAALIAEGAVVVTYRCEACGHHHTQADKLEMNRRGEFRGREWPAAHKSFHVHGLCSPHVAFAELASGLILARDAQARGDESKIQQFTIHQLGRPFDPKSVKLGDEALLDAVLHDMPAGHLPGAAEISILTFDVQGDYLRWMHTAWTRGEEPRCHIVAHGTVADMDEAKALLARTPHSIAGMDARYRQMEVYGLALRVAKLCPLMGAAQHLGGGAIVERKKGTEHGGKLMMVDTARTKNMIADLFAKGAITLHAGFATDPEAREELTNEERQMVRTTRGLVPRWIARGPNHLFDCLAMAAGLAVFRKILLHRRASTAPAPATIAAPPRPVEPGF